MTIELEISKKSYELRSGGTVKISALLSGAIEDTAPPGKKQKKAKNSLLWNVVEGPGEVDANGVYKAPTIYRKSPFDPEEVLVRILVVCAQDKSVRDEVFIRLKKASYIKQRHAVALSGTDIQFSTDADKVIPSWHIENYGHGMGMIDPKTGLYKAPDEITAEQDIYVLLKDQATGNTDKVAVKLFPVAMEPVASVKFEVIAGSIETQLPILSRNDPAGLGNFTCTLNPGIGSITDGGKYTPPSKVDKEMEIKVTATSNLDKTKKTTITAILKPATKCVNCGADLTGLDVCPRCNSTNNYGAYLDGLKKVKCPGCKSEQYAEDIQCLECGTKL